MCSFDLMKKEKFDKDLIKLILKENAHFFRKGNTFCLIRLYSLLCYKHVKQ